MRPSDRIISLLFRAGRVVHDQAPLNRQQDTPSMLWLHTLRYVSDSGRPLMKDVAAYLSVTPSSATSLINGLVKAGLLGRYVDHRDRRIVRLGVTPKGHTYLRRGLAMKTAHLRKVLARLNSTEQKQLVRILDKIITPISPH